MNKLHEYMKANHDMKTFTHVPQEKKILNLKTETIKGKRFYVLPSGDKYPSITTVLSDRGNAGILKWRESVGEQVANTIMRNAASRGTAVHTLTENYLNNQELSQQGVLPTALFTILKTELDRINNIVMQEGALYSDKWGVAGRVDCIAEYEGKLSVIDFKTSTKEKKEEWIENYFIQTSAYCEMYEELYGKTIDQIVILIVTEEGATQTFVKDKKDYLLEGSLRNKKSVLNDQILQVIKLKYPQFDLINTEFESKNDFSFNIYDRFKVKNLSINSSILINNSQLKRNNLIDKNII